MSSDDQLVEWFDSYLSTIGSTTWGGMGWTITDPKQRVKAAAWFVQEALKFEQWIEQHVAETFEEALENAIEQHDAGVHPGSEPSNSVDGDPDGTGNTDWPNIGGYI